MLLRRYAGIWVYEGTLGWGRVMERVKEGDVPWGGRVGHCVFSGLNWRRLVDGFDLFLFLIFLLRGGREVRKRTRMRMRI